MKVVLWGKCLYGPFPAAAVGPSNLRQESLKECLDGINRLRVASPTLLRMDAPTNECRKG